MPLFNRQPHYDAADDIDPSLSGWDPYIAALTHEISHGTPIARVASRWPGSRESASRASVEFGEIVPRH